MRLVPSARDAPFASIRRTLLGAIVAVIAIRALNIYGDPAPWKAQATTLRTIASFINTTKYPPSLL